MRQVETKEDGDLTQPDQSTFFMFRQRAASGVMSASALALATAATSARTLASAAVSSASMIQPTKTSLLPPLRESSRLRGQEAIERLSRLMATAESNGRRRRFKWVQRNSIFIGLAGIVLYVVSLLFERLGGRKHYISTPGFFLLSLGAVIISVCPVDEFDADSYFANHPRSRVLLWTALIINSSMEAFNAPHSNVPAASLAIWAAFGLAIPAPGDLSGMADASQHSTTMLCAWMLIDKIGDGIHLAYVSANFRVYSQRLNLGSAYSAPLFGITACLYLSSALSLCAWLAYQRRQFSASSASIGSSPTLAFYQCLNGYLAMMGLKAGTEGVWLTVRGDLGLGPWLIWQSIVFGAPCIIVAVVGRESLYLWMARRFERQWASRDGSEVVTVLRDLPPPVAIGNVWWVEDPHHPAAGIDEHTHWRRGVISKIDPDQGWCCVRIDERDLRSCKAPDSSSTSSSRKQGILSLVSGQNGGRNDTDASLHLQMPGSAGQLSSSALIDTAKNEIRCVDWINMTVTLLMPSKPFSSGELRSLSRPVRADETIDFFVSHAYLDNPAKKFAKLQVTALRFRELRGRDPTFWVQSACLGANLLVGTSLRVLPVHIEACANLLVITGAAYPKDLCCAFELYTLFAMAQHNEQAAQRVELVELDDGAQALKQLESISLDELTACEDPNEKRELRAAINIAGARGFIVQIRRLASWCISTTAGHAMARFKAERDQAKRAVYRRVMSLGTRAVLAGGVCLIVPSCLGMLGVTNVATKYVLGVVGEALVGLGAVIASTCPLENHGADKFFHRHTMQRIFFCLFLTIWMMTEAFIFMPHLHVLSAGSAAWAACEGWAPVKKTHRPKVSSLLSAMVHLSVTAWGVHNLYVAAHYNQARESADAPRETFIQNGLVQCGGGTFLFLWWHWRRQRFNRSDGSAGTGNTTLLYEMWYGFFTFRSIPSVISGISEIRRSNGNLTFGILTAAAGMLQASPMITVCLVGRARMFDIMAKRFARAHAVNDGAFIAQLLDTAVACEGDDWWVHRDQPKERYGKFDPRRNWQKGVVEKVRTTDFVVLLTPEPENRDGQSSLNESMKSSAISNSIMTHIDEDGSQHRLSRRKPDSEIIDLRNNNKSSLSRVSPAEPAKRHTIPITNRGLSADALMKKAFSELRCIDWANLSRELLSNSTSGASGVAAVDLFTLSRPVNSGEAVDYFMSHSCELPRSGMRAQIVKQRYNTDRS